MSFIAVYITHESEDAAKTMVDQLVEKKIIACGNLFPITSAYRWEGAICNESEWISLVKTQSKHWEPLKTWVENKHPYDVPCIMKIEVEANDSYENWIVEMTEAANFSQ
jgi:periplasmic divalent cation tolerance protein